MPMTIEELTAHLIESGTKSIERDPDFMPMLHVERDDGIAIFALAMDGHPYDAIRTVAPTIIQEGPIDRLVFVSDSYMWLGKEEDFVPGPLQPRFEAGDPKVSECLMNVIMTANGTSDPTAIQIMMPYTRTDEGVTWADITDRSDAEVSGRMADLLSTVVVVSHVVAAALADMAEEAKNA